MAEKLRVAIEKLPHAEGIDIPFYSTVQSAGMDLRAAFPEDEPILLEPGEHKLVPTGLKIALPPGTEAQIRPRSGLAFKHGITVLNSPGTIDADYRGEIGILLINHGKQAFEIQRGERVAQMIVAKHESVEWEPVEDLDATDRGAGGFGSTGV